jgi:ribosomal protein L32
MSQPKKKISRSRRKMRRYGPSNQLLGVTVVKSKIDNQTTRPHRVTLEQVESGRYLESTANGSK